MQRYSQFINFPIYLWASKEVEDQVDVEEAKTTVDNTISEQESSEEDPEDEEKDMDGSVDVLKAGNGK